MSPPFLDGVTRGGPPPPGDATDYNELHVTCAVEASVLHCVVMLVARVAATDVRSLGILACRVRTVAVRMFFAFVTICGQ